jgi:hypothetical protein
VVEGTQAESAQAKRAGQQLPTLVKNGAIYVKAVPGAQQITITWNP